VTANATRITPEITHLSWSPSSSHLLAVALKQRLVYIFSTVDENDEPAAVIRSGVEGLTRCEWNENGEEVICWSEGGVSTLFLFFQHCRAASLFVNIQLRVTIYSLVTGLTAFIASVIPPPTIRAVPSCPRPQLHGHRPRTLLPAPTPLDTADRRLSRSYRRSSNDTVDFTNGTNAGSYWAVAERHKGKDWLAIYDSADQFNMVRVSDLWVG
jgi:hypothetical protein